MAYQPVGPAYLLVGDPTQTAGSGMTQLGLVRNVQVDINIRQAYTSKDAISGAPVADGIYTLASSPRCEADLQDAAINMLEAIILNATKTTSTGGDTALGFPDRFKKVPAGSVPTLAIVPSTQAADGVGADNAIWFPATTMSGMNGLSFGRVEEGEITQGYNVAFEGAWRDQDQASASIPQNNRMGWMGPPAALGLTWYLPTIS